jgi:hypothetical protein
MRPDRRSRRFRRRAAVVAILLAVLGGTVAAGTQAAMATIDVTWGLSAGGE